MEPEGTRRLGGLSNCWSPGRHFTRLKTHPDLGNGDECASVWEEESERFLCSGYANTNLYSAIQGLGRSDQLLAS